MANTGLQDNIDIAGGDVAADFISGDESQSDVDAAAERRLVWKIDLL